MLDDFDFAPPSIAWWQFGFAWGICGRPGMGRINGEADGHTGNGYRIRPDSEFGFL